MVEVARYPKTNILSTFTAGRGVIHGGHAGSSTPVESCITIRGHAGPHCLLNLVLDRVVEQIPYSLVDVKPHGRTGIDSGRGVVPSS